VRVRGFALFSPTDGALAVCQILKRRSAVAATLGKLILFSLARERPAGAMGNGELAPLKSTAEEARR
jgi:hypothetical protein